MFKISVVKTDKKVCFITDCEVKSGYDHSYHPTQLTRLKFDGKSPTPTLHKNWFMLDEFPTKVTKPTKGEVVSTWWELKNKDLESSAIPLRLREELDYDDDRYSLYAKKVEYAPDYEIEVNVEWNTLVEVSNFDMPPKISYPIRVKSGWDYKEAVYTNLDVNHNLVDTLIIPSPVLQGSPCSISAAHLYEIIRKHVQTNINPKVAFVDSDYDFCFSVNKRVNLLQEEVYTYTNPFARTKRERQKVKTGTKTEKSFKVFSMAPKAYQSYPVLTDLVAENEWQLKEDLDQMLNDIMEKINAPLKQCECCNGTGYILED